MRSALTCRLNDGSPQSDQTEGTCCIQPVVVRLVSTLSNSAARLTRLRFDTDGMQIPTNVAAMIAERESVKYIHATELPDAP